MKSFSSCKEKVFFRIMLLSAAVLLSMNEEVNLENMWLSLYRYDAKAVNLLIINPLYERLSQHRIVCLENDTKSV